MMPSPSYYVKDETKWRMYRVYAVTDDGENGRGDGGDDDDNKCA